MMNTTTEDARRNTEEDTRAAHRNGDPRRSPAGAKDRRVDFARMREIGASLGRQVGAQARKRPYVALSAAAGVGFVAGSLFGTRFGQMLIAAGLGYVGKNLLDGDFGISRLEENIEKLARERTRA